MKRLPYSPRPATLDDIEQVVAIEAGANNPPWNAEAFRAELAKPHAQFWVVTDNETDSDVLAYSVFAQPAEQAHLQTVAVREGNRRQGIAAYLMRHVLAFVQRKDAESMILEVRKGNTAAVQLYQNVGFVVIRTIPKFYPDGEDAFVMLYKVERERILGDVEADFESDLPAPGAKLN